MMSHTTQHVNLGTTLAFAIIQMTGYTNGGEQFTVAEFGLTAPLVDFFVIRTHGDTPDDTPTYIDLTTTKQNGIAKMLSIATLNELPTGPCTYKFLAIVQGS